MRARGVFTLIAAFAVLAAGCGGSSPPSAEAYERAVVDTRDRTDFSLERVTQATSKKQFLERMDEAADAIDDAAGDLDDLGAAKGFENETDGLVDALKQLSTDVGATAEQIRQPGFDELLTGTRGLSFESWDKVNGALRKLRKQGIGVRLLARH